MAAILSTFYPDKAPHFLRTHARSSGQCGNTRERPGHHTTSFFGSRPPIVDYWTGAWSTQRPTMRRSLGGQDPFPRTAWGVRTCPTSVPLRPLHLQSQCRLQSQASQPPHTYVPSLSPDARLIRPPVRCQPMRSPRAVQVVQQPGLQPMPVPMVQICASLRTPLGHPPSFRVHRATSHGQTTLTSPKDASTKAMRLTIDTGTGRAPPPYQCETGSHRDW